MIAWNETYSQNTMSNNMGNFTFQKCNELVGNEISIDVNSDISYISMYFLNKWQSQNEVSEVIFKDGSVLTSIK